MLFSTLGPIVAAQCPLIDYNAGSAGDLQEGSDRKDDPFFELRLHTAIILVETRRFSGVANSGADLPFMGL